MELAKKINNFLTDPKIRFGYLSKLGFYDNLSDKQYVEKEWFSHWQKPLNLENPQTFNEKLQWLKIYNHNPQATIMVDKYAVKQYVSERIGKQYIIPTLGMWDSFYDIDFNLLPEQFVLKVTHDSGGLVICKEKNKLDINATKKILQKSLKRDYYKVHREWPYKNVPRRIIAEKYMKDRNNEALTDYKFYCFNGVPLYLYVSVGLDNHETAKISFLTTDWTFAKFGRTDYKALDVLPPKPQNLEKMIEISKKLSTGFPFLRVDLYEINGQVYFGELTFTPCAGMMPFNPPDADLEIGKLLDISYLRSK